MNTLEDSAHCMGYCSLSQLIQGLRGEISLLFSKKERCGAEFVAKT